MSIEESNSTTAICASCQKSGKEINLKICVACKMVRYCSVACQKAHRPLHKKECKQRAKELYDDELFKQPSSKGEECPICMITFSSSRIGASAAGLGSANMMSNYQLCCGKVICTGCMNEAVSGNPFNFPCPYCRVVVPVTNESLIENLTKRVEVHNDDKAMNKLAFEYQAGTRVTQNLNKAWKLWSRAAEMGNPSAHFNIARIYMQGGIDGVAVDLKKCQYHLEQAAMGGHELARFNLGSLEGDCGKGERAKKHFMIGARAGHEDSLNAIRDGYKAGYVTKDEYVSVLRAYKEVQDETKSENREKMMKKIQRRMDQER